MAKPFSFSTKRAGGNIYVQFALPDGGRTYQKSTGTNNRKEAEKIAMQLFCSKMLSALLVLQRRLCLIGDRKNFGESIDLRGMIFIMIQEY